MAGLECARELLGAVQVRDKLVAGVVLGLAAVSVLAVPLHRFLSTEADAVERWKEVRRQTGLGSTRALFGPPLYRTLDPQRVGTATVRRGDRQALLRGQLWVTNERVTADRWGQPWYLVSGQREDQPPPGGGESWAFSAGPDEVWSWGQGDDIFVGRHWMGASWERYDLPVADGGLPTLRMWARDALRLAVAIGLLYSGWRAVSSPRSARTGREIALGLLTALTPCAALWLLVEAGGLDFFEPAGTVVPARLAMYLSGAAVICIVCVAARLRRPLPSPAQ